MNEWPLIEFRIPRRGTGEPEQRDAGEPEARAEQCQLYISGGRGALAAASRGLRGQSASGVDVLRCELRLSQHASSDLSTPVTIISKKHIYKPIIVSAR
jgi:hypothetical protein